MKTTGNTILITGGGSGIGYETAKSLAQLGNKIIITGRNESKLNTAAATLPNTTAIAGDINDEQSVDLLVKRIYSEFPDLNMLMNNAGMAYSYSIFDDEAPARAIEEMTTNYFSVVRLTTRLLPLLRRQKDAAIINVSSIVAFAPGLRLPTYSASKAALHSYTQTLRLALRDTPSIGVFEVMPPLVDTEFARELKGDKISPAEVATTIVEGLHNNLKEIHVASTAGLYKVFLEEPAKAIRVLNGIAAA